MGDTSIHGDRAVAARYFMTWFCWLASCVVLIYPLEPDLAG